MKMTKKIAIAAVGSALAFPLLAAEVSGDDAKTAVAGWVNLKAAVGEDFTATPSSVREYQGKDGKGKYYVVELEGGGFVVTSGDTEINPVLAYSKEGTWVDDVKKNPLLAMLPLDVAAAMAELSSANSAVNSGGKRLAAGGSSSSTTASANAGLWSTFKSAGAANGGRRLGAKIDDDTIRQYGDLRVGKLLTTQWNQQTQTYNLYVPKGTSDDYPCGCVATAGAQIMKFWEWPKTKVTRIMNFKGKVDGSSEWTLDGGWNGTAWNPAFGGPYEWSKMTDKPTARTDAAYAISRLTRDVGLACHMDYASNGSGAQTSTLFRRFTDQFGYANAAYASNLSDSDADQSSWKRAFLASFNAGLPCGVNVPGHAIVADGYGYYGNELYVHFNFGWSGTHDAWYSNPNSGGMSSAGFASLNAIIYNIYPQGAANGTIVSGRVLDTAGSPVKTSNKTVVAKNTDSGDTYTAVSTNAIYALILPSGTYDIGYEYSAGTVFFTNMVVEACVSTSLVNGKNEEEQIGVERSGSYYPNTSWVHNIYDMDLKPAAITAPTYSTTWGTKFYTASAKVVLSTATESAKIYYTTDGSEPTVSSTLYAGPISLTATTTIKAKAFFGEFYSSDTMTASFTKGDYAAEYLSNADGRAAHWVNESEATHNVTGTWTTEKAFADGRFSVDGFNDFTPSTPSKGKKVTVKATVSTVGTYGVDTDTYQGVRAAVRICNVNGSLAFQVYTSDANGAKWVAATGATPAAGTKYDVKVELDTSAMTYEAYVATAGGTEVKLTSGGSGTFPFATRAKGAVKKIALDGDGAVSALEGSYNRSKGVLLIVE